MIVSTHSDYIVREFNNLLMIASEKPEIKQYAKNKGYEKDEILFPSDVSAYMFNFKSKSAKQCIVTKLPINENGFEVPSVDQTIDDQNEIAEELSYLVKYAKEKK
jgi:glutaredoxin 2